MGFWSKLGNIATGGALGMANSIKNKNLKGVATGGMFGNKFGLRGSPQRPGGPGGPNLGGRFMGGYGPMGRGGPRDGMDGMEPGLEAFRQWQQSRGGQLGDSQQGFAPQERPGWQGLALQEQLGGQPMPQPAGPTPQELNQQRRQRWLARHPRPVAPAPAPAPAAPPTPDSAMNQPDSGYNLNGAY